MPTAPKQFRPGPSKQQAAKAYDARRGSASQRGYGTRWAKFVHWLKQQPEQAVCGVCERAATEMFDHVEAVSGPNDPRFFELSAVLGECRPCHNMKTNLCDGGFGIARTAEGEALLQRLKVEAKRRAAAIEAKGGYA